MIMFRRKSESEKQIDRLNKEWFTAAVCESSCERLLEDGFPVERRDKHDRTAFYVAAKAGNVAFMQFLKKHGANPDARDSEGQTILHFLVRKHKEDYGSYIRDNIEASKYLTTAKWLVGLGADQNAKDKDGNTPLHLAIKRGLNYTVAIEKLLPLSDPTLTNNDGEAPFKMAARLGNRDADRFFQHYREFVQRRDSSAPAAEVKAEPAAVKEEEKKEPPKPEKKDEPAVPASAPQWQVLAEDEIACVADRPAIGYRLTDIFNFATQTHTRIAHNHNTKADTMVVRDFSDYTHKQAIERAAAEYEKMAGKAPVQPHLIQKIIPAGK